MSTADRTLEPAMSVIAKCGGYDAVAEMTGRSTVRVRRWTYSKPKGGTGGLIPADCQVLLLHGARLRGIDLQPADFFCAPVAADPDHLPNPEHPHDPSPDAA